MHCFHAPAGTFYSTKDHLNIASFAGHTDLSTWKRACYRFTECWVPSVIALAGPHQRTLQALYGPWLDVPHPVSYMECATLCMHSSTCHPHNEKFIENESIRFIFGAKQFKILPHKGSSKSSEKMYVISQFENIFWNWMFWVPLSYHHHPPEETGTFMSQVTCLKPSNRHMAGAII